MHLRQNDTNSQWLIVVFNPADYVANIFMPLYLDKARGPLIIQTWYPNALASIWVPSTMSAVMAALRNKSIGCHFCHDMILRQAGIIALKDDGRALQNQFASQADANDYFIQVVVTNYVTTTLHDFRNQRRKWERLKRKVPSARRKWIKKRDERRQAEAYLGISPFAYELRRACEEFYSALKNEWGFSPIKLFLMK
jgi:hypothetical protein